jgi:nucleotide-binding universal stress UspA family protein
MSQPGKRPRIVVGVDGSPSSILALRWAGALAPLLEAEIRAVTAWEFEILPGHLTPAVANPDRVAREVCSEAASKAFGAAVPPALELVIRRGPAPKVLIDESRQAQLLVGSRGCGGLEGMLIGAVSAAVAEHAKCAVLVAHGTELPPSLAALAGTNWDHVVPRTSEAGRNHAGA